MKTIMSMIVEGLFCRRLVMASGTSIFPLEVLSEIRNKKEQKNQNGLTLYT